MKKVSIEFKQLTREQLKAVKGGMSSSSLEQCGVQAGGALCIDSFCCSPAGFCGTTHEYCDGDFNDFCGGCQSGPCTGC